MFENFLVRIILLSFLVFAYVGMSLAFAEYYAITRHFFGPVLLLACLGGALIGSRMVDSRIYYPAPYSPVRTILGIVARRSFFPLTIICADFCFLFTRFYMTKDPLPSHLWLFLGVLTMFPLFYLVTGVFLSLTCYRKSKAMALAFFIPSLLYLLEPLSRLASRLSWGESLLRLMLYTGLLGMYVFLFKIALRFGSRGRRDAAIIILFISLVSLVYILVFLCGGSYLLPLCPRTEAILREDNFGPLLFLRPFDDLYFDLIGFKPFMIPNLLAALAFHLPMTLYLLMASAMLWETGPWDEDTFVPAYRREYEPGQPETARRNGGR